MPSKSLDFIDSHTGGEPTRLIFGGLPDLPANPKEARDELKRSHDWVRVTSVLEPRGSEIMVGAALLPSREPSVDHAVVFFNNAGYLGMCGHGAIGVIASLAYEGKLQPGKTKLGTPAGTVECELHQDGKVSFENVPSYRYRKDVELEVHHLMTKVKGDIAYGGNWFFLTKYFEFDLAGIPLAALGSQIPRLKAYAQMVRTELEQQGITGADGAIIDHIELFGPSKTADARNFVLCPGLEYDRSPCGTGTSAKLACLYEDGKLEEGHIWRQESITGSIFEGSVVIRDGKIVPRITGQAWITAKGTLIFSDDDPLTR